MTSDPLKRYLTQHGARLERHSRLRTMSPSEVSDIAMQVYQTLGASILRATAAPTLFCLAAFAYVIEIVLPSMTQTTQPGNMAIEVGEAALSVAMGFFVGVPLFLIGISFVSAQVTGFVSDYMIGNVPDPQTSQREALRALPGMFKLKLRELFISGGAFVASVLMLMLSALLDANTTTNVGSGAVATLGILGIIAGILILFVAHSSHALAPAIVMIENLKPHEAARRSKMLLKIGRGEASTPISTTYGLILLIWLVLAAGSASLFGLIESLDLPRNLGGNSWLATLITKTLDLLPWYLMLWVTIPIWSVTATIVYFERRVRKEGYDIVALTKDVENAGKAGRFEL